MQIEFIRGWGPYQPGRVYDLPEPVAEIHVMVGRARAAAEVAPAIVPELPKPKAKGRR